MRTNWIVTLLAVGLLGGCSPGADVGQVPAELVYPVSDGGICKVGESGCYQGGLATCVAGSWDPTKTLGNWSPPVACGYQCVVAAPGSDGLEKDYCQICKPGTLVENDDYDLVCRCNSTGTGLVSCKPVRQPPPPPPPKCGAEFC
jgi:hypothetical protein